MKPEAIAGISIIIIFMVLPLVWAIFHLIRQGHTRRTTQRQLTDPDLLRLINDEPDGMVSPHRLRDKTDLTLS